MRLQEWTRTDRRVDFRCSDTQRAKYARAEGPGEAEDFIQRHNADVRAANAEMERLEDIAASARDERDEARAEVERLKEREKLLVLDRLEAQESGDAARSEAARLRSSVHAVSSDLDAALNTSAARAARIGELEAQLVEAKNLRDGAFESRDDWNGEVERLKEAYEQQAGALRAANAQLAEGVEVLKWYGYGENELFAQGIFFGGNGINRRHVETRELADDIAETHNTSLEAAYALGIAKSKDAEEKLAKVREVLRSRDDSNLRENLRLVAAIVELPHVHEVVRIDGIIGRCACGATAIMRAEWKDAPK